MSFIKKAMAERDRLFKEIEKQDTEEVPVFKFSDEEALVLGYAIENYMSVINNRRWVASDLDFEEVKEFHKQLQEAANQIFVMLDADERLVLANDKFITIMAPALSVYKQLVEAEKEGSAAAGMPTAIADKTLANIAALQNKLKKDEAPVETSKSYEDLVDDLVETDEYQKASDHEKNTMKNKLIKKLI